MLLRFILLVLLMLVLQILAAQELPANTQQQLENLAELSEVEMEDDALLQQLIVYKNDPLNVNEAGEEDLQVFPFLSPLQIQNFLVYRTALGNLISVYELQSIPAWDLSTIRKLLPYITVHQPVHFSKNIGARMKDGEHLLLLRTSRIIEKAKGYDTSLNNHYLGGRNHLLLRYQYKFNNLLQYGFTADNDAGEQFFKGAQSKGFDFYSAHLFVRNLGIIKSLAFGDFNVNLGQGLVHWQSMAFTKGAEITSIKRQSPVLKPYTSSGEFYFNRGAGITIQKGKTEATVFASLRKIDANIIKDTSGREVLTSFISSGLHRTPSEMEDKGNTGLTSLGGNLSWNNKTSHIGFNAVYHSFSIPVEKRNEPYNLFALKGYKTLNMSADYSFTYKNLHFFGEAATDKAFHKAFLNGVLASLDPKVDISLLHRYYEKDYVILYGKAFSENTLPANETGLYGGLLIRPNERLIINAYSDVYRFPWLKYRVDAPSKGSDYFVQLTYQPSKQMEVYTRYRNEKKSINELETGSSINGVVAKLRQQWRVHFTYVVSPMFTWQSRVEMTWYDNKGKGEEEGLLFYTGGSYKPNNRLSVNGRIFFFETSGYNSRIYAYENDVLYSFTTPFYSGNGFRYYFNFNYDVTKCFALWLKIARTVYRDQLSNGSGTGELPGNKKSEVKLQAALMF